VLRPATVRDALANARAQRDEQYPPTLFTDEQPRED
jgi:hypothetical protein